MLFLLNSFYDRFIFTNGLAYKHNNFYLLNLPFVLLPADALAAIAEQNDPELNKKIYYAVKSFTKEALREEFRIDFGVEGDKGLEFMETYFTASGWGKLQRTDMDVAKSRALVTVSNSIVAGGTKKAKHHADSFLRGFLAGVFSNYFKKDVDCVEVKCVALGDSNCDFVVKPLADFDFGNKITRSQLEVK